MTDEQRQLLSAYLDNQVSPEQRRQAEELLARDPEARVELEGLRALAGQLNAAAPPLAQVPAEFREKIMARLKTGAKGPQRPGGGFSSPGAGLTAAGLVLLGLIGVFVAMDRQAARTDKAVKPQPAAESLEQVETPAPGSQPDYRGQVRGVAEGDIQSVSSGKLPDARRRQPARLDGQAYISGSAGNLSGSRTPGLTELNLPALSADTHYDLERFDAWSREEAGQRMAGLQASPAALLKLAADFRLHPGLLAAACGELPQTNAAEVARRLRNSLDGSAGKSEPERLQQAVKDLGGDGNWETRWKKQVLD
ncbi:MAG: hypothetical protein AB1439_05920 [candidate division FCPU426 bacterium]